MALKGTSGTSMGSYEMSDRWKKKQRNKAKRFDAYCKRQNGPVRVTKLTPEEIEKRFSRNE